MSLPTLVLVLTALAQEPSAAPPIQRPKAMGEPTPPRFSSRIKETRR